MSRLDGQVAIVTGAAQGIGRKIAEGLAGVGARVVVADVQAADEVANSLGGMAVAVDVSDQAGCERMAQAAHLPAQAVDLVEQAQHQRHRLVIDGVFPADFEDQLDPCDIDLAEHPGVRGGHRPSRRAPRL